MKNAGTKHWFIFFLPSLLAANPYNQDLPLWLWFSVLQILMLKNCYMLSNYYGKRNAAHEGFEGKIQLLVNKLWFQHNCFPNTIRRGDQGGTSSLEAQFCPVINTTAKSGSKWEAALSLTSENSDLFPKIFTCMEFSEHAAVLGILLQGSSYFC